MIIIEINQRDAILGVLRKLRGGDSSPFGGWGYASGANLLTSVANDFRERLMVLATQRSRLTSHEGIAENATLTRTEEVLLLWYFLFINI